MLMKSRIDRRSLLGAGASLMLAGKAWAQQVPIPTTAAEVPGPPPGTAMTKAYVQTVGRMAYLWGWPLVNMRQPRRGVLQSARTRPAGRRRAGRVRRGTRC